MSPFDAAAGFSDWTPDKYRLANTVLGTWKYKAKAVADKHDDVRFGFIDATAGPGHVNGMAGTPIMLAQLASDFESPVLLFERNEATYDRLREQLPTSAICADSLEFLRDQAAMRALRPMRFGLLIYDPNPRDGLLPVEELCAWGRGNRRDLLVFVAANQAYKRTGHEFAPHVRALEQVWTGVCMTEPHRAGGMQWVAIFATRWAALAKDVCRACGFALVNDPEGKEWLRVASTTGAQRSPITGQMTIDVGGTFPYE